MSHKSDSIVAASFNAGMIMAAFIMTVAVKKRLSAQCRCNPAELLGEDYARQPSSAPFVLPALSVRETRIGDPGALSADKGV